MSKLVTAEGAPVTFLFDLFFTLVTFEPGVYEREFERLDIPMTEWERCVAESGAYVGRVTEPMEIIRAFTCCAKKSFGEEQLRRLCENRMARVREIVTKVRPEILETLRTLKERGHGLCLVSNADAIDVLPWKDSPLCPLFDEVVFSCEVRLQKPDPAIYRLAMRRMGAQPEDCIFVGDGGSNELAGAKAVGLRTVQVRHFLQREAAGADCAVDRFADILAIS